MDADPEPRPSAWWFAAGAALVVAAVVVFVLVLWRTLAGFVAVDATVPADDRPHTVTWTGTGQRMVWVRERDDADCTFTDPASGDEITPGPTLASYTKTVDGITWLGSGTISGSSGGVEVTCASAYGPVQVGPEPDAARFGGGIVIAILVPLLLGMLGLVVLIVTGVLWLTRGPRRPTPPGPGAPPPWAGPAR